MAMMVRQVEGGRLAIIAGGGRLPFYVAEAARANGEQPFIFALNGESSIDWAGFDHEAIAVSNISRFKVRADALGIDRIIMSGSVSRRPALGEMRLGWRGILKIPKMIRTIIGGGDNTVLTAVIELLEDEKRRVIAVQDVVPSLLATLGPIGNVRPDAADLKDIAAATQAARLLGSLDVGQGAVAVGGRVVALEGPEGTDAMLGRVADLKSAQRISARRRGVLVKLCKPQQDLRVDLPSAGLATIENAHAAGLAGVALEAGRALLLDADAVRAFADSHGMFLVGIDIGDFP
jgi:DUF1009 family protein